MDHPASLILLVQDILTRVRERQGYVTKTKLFKYLYLVDVESYRFRERLLTGFNWIFFIMVRGQSTVRISIWP